MNTLQKEIKGQTDQSRFIESYIEAVMLLTLSEIFISIVNGHTTENAIKSVQQKNKK